MKAPVLGALELRVLKELWTGAGPKDARSILEALRERRIGLSTVQATLERLHRKGLLERRKVGRAYHYDAAVTRERLIAALIGDLVERYAEGELGPVIAGFVELVGDSEPALLRQLQAAAERGGSRR